MDHHEMLRAWIMSEASLPHCLAHAYDLRGVSERPQDGITHRPRITDPDGVVAMDGAEERYAKLAGEDRGSLAAGDGRVGVDQVSSRFDNQ
jgi:hypothetical protein